MDYRKVAERVAQAVKKDNIVAAAHCATRLRLVVKDVKNIDQAALDNDPDLKGTFNANGQYQIIVGPGDVNGVYDETKNCYSCGGIIEKNHYQRVIVVFVKQASQKGLYASTVAAPLFETVAERTLIHEKIC